MDYQYIFVGSVTELNVTIAIGTISNFLLSGATKLNFFISSPGGDADAGFRLYDFLKSLPITVETIAFGQVSSVAVTIYLAGSRRTCTKGASFFIHEGSFSNAYQNTAIKIIDETIRQLNNLTKRTIDIISTETGKPVEQVEKIVKEGKLMTASQAKRFRLVNDTIEKLNLKQAPLPSPAQQTSSAQGVVQPTTPTPAVSQPSQPEESTPR